MKKLVVFLLIFCLLSTMNVSVLATENDLQSDRIAFGGNCNGLDADTSLLGTDKLVDNASAAFLYDIGSDTLMYAYNPDLQVSPSSLVKIMTALIAVERGELQEYITVGADTIESLPAGAVSADLVAGEQLTLMDLLYCMMVGSANDAAAVIAAAICGSQEIFVREMNERAIELGCTGTNFTNAHGLHDDAQYSTVRDIGRILAEAMKLDAFREVFCAKQYALAATNKSEARDFATGNYLMNVNADGVEIYYDGRVTGGRTGVANDGTRCLAVSAEANGLELISVLVGCESEIEDDGYTVKSFGSFRETTALLDAGFNGYKAVCILYAGQALTQQSVMNGVNDVILGPNTDISAVIPANATVDDLKFDIKPVVSFQAPIESGERAAEIEVWYGNMCVAKTDLFSMNRVIAANSNQSGGNESLLSRELRIVIWVLLAVIAAVALLVFGIIAARRLRIVANQKHDKQYRRNRRRSR